MRYLQTKQRVGISIRWIGVLLTVSVLISGCTVAGVDVFDAVEIGTKLVRGFKDFTPEEEYYIGRAVGATVAGKYDSYDDQQANMYVNLLGQTLAKASEMPETFGGYHFQILDSEEINAFAAPGGLIFVTTGLIRCTQSEDALAAVLAHEIVHVQFKHGLQAIKKSRVSSLITETAVDVAESRTGGLTGVAISVFQDSITDITTTLINNGYSRSFEYEADKGAVTILQRVGYNPNGLVDMLNVMAEKLTPGGTDFAKTHPSPADRIGEIQKIIGPYAPVEPNTVRNARFEAAVGNI